MTGDAQNPSKDAQVEGVESALLAGVEGLGFTAVEQCAKYAGLVHLYLGADGEHRVVLGPLSEMCQTEGCYWFANPFVQFAV